MSTKHGTLILFGSGPGIGTHVAQSFAARNFDHILLLSRNQERLYQEAAHISSVAPNVKIDTISVDLADLASVSTALSQLDAKLAGRTLETVIFNAARMASGQPCDYPIQDLETDLRVSVTALYMVAQWAMPRLMASKVSVAKPTFLVTGGAFSRNPHPDYFSLSACKAAQFNLVHSLNKQFGKEGAHCGIVVVGGVVAKESKYCSPLRVAEAFWELYQQRGNSDLMIDLVDPTWEEMMMKES